MQFLPQTIIDISRYILAILFIFSGSVKIMDLKGFAKIVEEYAIIPYKLVRITAYPLPFIELITGILFLLNLYPLYTSVLSLLLLLVSTFFVIYALIEKKKLENCGCFGTIIKVPASWKKVIQNLFWIILAIMLIISNL